MSTDVVTTGRPMSVPIGREVDGLERIATNLANAGIYRKTAKTAPEVFAILLAARDMGVAPTSALAGGIHMVEGKPEVSANLQAQLLREYRSPEGSRYDFRILTPARERSKECHIEFRRFNAGELRWEQGEPVGEEFFDLADAKRAGLDGKDNYKKYPKMMLLARCLSDGIASHCPETARGLRVYGEGEIGGQEPVPAVADEPAPAAPAPSATAEPEPVDADVVIETITDEQAAELTEFASGLTRAQVRGILETAEIPGADIIVASKFSATPAEQSAAVAAALIEYRNAEAQQNGGES